MNFAKPNTPMPGVADVISLNDQGEGIRYAPAYDGLRGIRTAPFGSSADKVFGTMEEHPYVAGGFVRTHRSHEKVSGCEK